VGRGLVELTGCGAPATAGSTGTETEYFADVRAVAIEGSIAQRQPALAGPKPESATEALVRQVRGNIDPLGHVAIFEGI